MVRSLGVAVLVCVSLLSGCSSAQVDALPDGVDGCPQVQVIGVRGQSQSLDHHRGLGTEVDAVVTALEERLDARGIDDVDVEAVQHRSRNVSDPAIYAADVEAGRRMLAERLDAATDACPDADLVVVAFSQGAQIAQETLAEHPGFARSVDALAVLGSPRHDPDAPFAHLDLVGPTATNAGSLGAGPDLGGLDERTVDACLDLDVVCNAGGGTDYTVHKQGYTDPVVIDQVADALDRVLLP